MKKGGGGGAYEVRLIPFRFYLFTITIFMFFSATIFWFKLILAPPLRSFFFVVILLVVLNILSVFDRYLFNYCLLGVVWVFCYFCRFIEDFFFSQDCNFRVF